jgi:hypothetical protein
VDRPLILDGRNTLDADELSRNGFHYISVGRTAVVCDANIPPAEGTIPSTNMLNDLADVL